MFVVRELIRSTARTRASVPARCVLRLAVAQFIAWRWIAAFLDFNPCCVCRLLVNLSQGELRLIRAVGSMGRVHPCGCIALVLCEVDPIR